MVPPKIVISVELYEFLLLHDKLKQFNTINSLNTYLLFNPIACLM